MNSRKDAKMDLTRRRQDAKVKRGSLKIVLDLEAASVRLKHIYRTHMDFACVSHARLGSARFALPVLWVPGSSLLSFPLRLGVFA
jgi:hypothetical protein